MNAGPRNRKAASSSLGSHASTIHYQEANWVLIVVPIGEIRPATSRLLTGRRPAGGVICGPAGYRGRPHGEEQRGRRNAAAAAVQPRPWRLWFGLLRPGLDRRLMRG